MELRTTVGCFTFFVFRKKNFTINWPIGVNCHIIINLSNSRNSKEKCKGSTNKISHISGGIVISQIYTNTTDNRRFLCIFVKMTTDFRSVFTKP